MARFEGKGTGNSPNSALYGGDSLGKEELAAEARTGGRGGQWLG
jgi:hypothetical protein